MSIKTEESLNCPCNGIFSCGLHSIPKNIMSEENKIIGKYMPFNFKAPYPHIAEPGEIITIELNNEKRKTCKGTCKN